VGGLLRTLVLMDVNKRLKRVKGVGADSSETSEVISFLRSGEERFT